MRVIHQLIAYFRDHGALSARQLDELRRSGFLAEDEPAGGASGAPALRGAGKRAEAAEWQSLEDVPDWRARRTRKPLGAAPLCRALSELSAAWPARLSAFFAIAAELEPAPSMRRSFRVIRQTDRAVLASVLASVLARRDVSLTTLSASLDIQDYRALLRDGRQPTRALGAYRALMRTYGYTPLGKYAWILRFEPVNDVFNLILAKRAVLRALHDLYVADPEALAPYLRGEAVSNLFWALVILRSALADDPWAESRHKSAGRASYLDRLWPPRATLERAALYGVFMAPAAVLAFLTRDLDVPSDARGNPPWRIPSDWTSNSEKHTINFRDPYSAP